MEDIVYEIVGGAIILGIILVVITVFRNSAGTIRDQVTTQAQIEDTSIVDTIGIEGGQYSIEKVREAWNYSKVADSTFQVEIKNGSKSKLITKDADLNTYLNDTATRYTLDVLYLSENTTNGYTSISAKEKARTKSDQGTVAIRFYFYKD